MALLSLLVLVLSLQPFMCLLHCAQWDLLRQRSAAHAYHILCSTGEHAGGDEIVAAAPAPSMAAGAPSSIPAYWPGMLSTWTFAPAAYDVVLRVVLQASSTRSSFATVPATPPPR
jgi:hypothetical protein